jgi:predicted DCC family thiol-disulfide oxidoreductase YuxK
MNDQLPLILYDPECPLCLRFKQGLSLLDKNLRFRSAREPEVYEDFPELNRQECLKQVHLITSQKEILAGPAVVEYLLQTLPGVSKFAWLLDNESGTRVKDYFYQKVEELRELTHRTEDCEECPRK